nr:putative disease resistance rpp13-like protein 1 [Quercus suber]
MAETVVVEAALSAIFHAVFERIASSGVVNYFMERKLNDESLQKLKMFLLSANAVLVDAEEKQITNPAVKEWLDELNDAVHDAEDLLDEIAYEDLQYNLRAKSQTGTSKVWNSITAFISFDEGIPSKLEKVLAKLKIIIEQIGVLRLKEVASGVPLSSSRTTTSCQEKCDVLGRDMDKEAIFELWQSDDASSDEICVVPIKGERWLSFLWCEYKDIVKMIDLDLFQKFKCLRVLSFSGKNIRELPVSIGNLKHLRYLNIRNTRIKHLPNSLCNLYNLQTLILSPYITELPTNMGKLINLRHLNNSESKMKKMPPQMGKMKNLIKLPIFVVGKHDGSSISELGELQHLSGKLSILNLENVHCINKDTMAVILKDKHDLSKLELKWEHVHGPEDSEKERNVLEQLCPHTKLNSLTIEHYEGTSFPNWLGDCSFSNMVSIVLRNCKYCFSLPPFGQLHALKELKIEGFDRLLGVGHEFYGNDSSTIKPFRSLKYLSFKNMREWQEWIIFEDEVFSCLQWLHISYCPKLNKNLPNQLPSLTKLEIRECKQLVASFPWAPALHELYFDGKIQLPSVRYYPSLESMIMIGGCDSLWSFPLQFFPKLKFIEIFNCKNLESLSASTGSHLDLTSLTYLKISRCPTFVSFLSGGICARKLTEIEVFSCKKLKSLPEGMVTLLPSLSSLQLYKCPELDSFPKDGLPPSLKTLTIQYCEKLISCHKEWGLQALHSLRDFIIWSKNEELESFPEEALLPPTLTNFSISSFPNLKSLNGKGFQHLTSLQSLTIWYCDKLQCLPEQGLPTSLSVLQIFGCPLLNQQCEKEIGKDWLKIAHIPYIEID